MSESVTSGTLLHLLVVGGTLDEWARFGAEDWARRIELLGCVAARHRAQWVTLRPYASGIGSSESTMARSETAVRGETAIGSCVVITDPTADGRVRFATAMATLPPDESVNEASVAAALYDPADSEPDLVLVLGPPTALPPSVVWELAYAELVFVDVDWRDLDEAIVEDAIEEFSVRRRRFGGLDND